MYVTVIIIHYLNFHRRRKVTKAAKLAFPGNDLPLFRPGTPSAAKLDALVEDLKDTHTSDYFNVHCLREHILNTTAEPLNIEIMIMIRYVFWY